MSEKISTYVGLACAALVLAGFVPGISDAATGTGERSSAANAAAGRMSGSKGDFLGERRPSARTEVTIIRIEGDHAAVSMRTRTGDLVYHADGAAGLSVAAKNVILPPAPDKMTAPAAMPAQASSPAGNPVQAQPRKLPVGCERLVSVLVKSAERDRIGRCLV